MENQLIELYLFVCHIYDTRSATCFQRLSTNSKPRFTDQELVCIWFFAHLNEKYEKKQIHRFIAQYWSEWFPHLPAYQTFCYRLNLSEQTFQSIGAELSAHLRHSQTPESDHLIDSMPIMLACGGARLLSTRCPPDRCCRLLCGEENLFSRRSPALDCDETLCPTSEPFANPVM